MNWLDILILCVMGASIVYSLVKGFVKEGFFFLGVMLGLLAALRGYSYLSVIMQGVVGRPTTAAFLSFLIILALVFIIIRVWGWRVGKAFEGAGLTPLDRVLGAVIGALKGATIISVMLLLIIGFTDRGKLHVADSQFAIYFLEFSRMISIALPKDVRKGMQRTYENLQDPERIRELVDTLNRDRKRK